MFALYSGVGILSLFYCKGFPEPLIANIDSLPASFVFIGIIHVLKKNETMKTKQLLIAALWALLCAACTPRPDADEESPASGAGNGPMVEDEWEEL